MIRTGKETGIIKVRWDIMWLPGGLKRLRHPQFVDGWRDYALIRERKEKDAK